MPTPRPSRPQAAKRSATPKSGELVSAYIVDRAEAWLGDDLRRTRAGLARSAGLTAERVHDFLDGARHPTQRTLRAVAHAVGTNFGELETAAQGWLVDQRRQKRRTTPRPARGDRSKTPDRVESNRIESNKASRREKYPNRAMALQAAQLVEHDPEDIAAVREVVLPPGSPDPSPRTWLLWVERARTERLSR